MFMRGIYDDGVKNSQRSIAVRFVLLLPYYPPDVTIAAYTLPRSDISGLRT